MIHLVLGGARSGKTRFALDAAAATGKPLTYIATAEAGDAEMATRIARHRAERDARWRTVEAPRDLAGAIGALASDEAVVVDCLTLWLSNAMLAGDDLAAAVDALSAALGATRAALWLVSNEVGWGIVPDNALARAFRDQAGFLHQRLARQVDRVTLVVAGLPMTLK